MKIIVAIIPTNLAANSLLSLFCPAFETINKNLSTSFTKVGGLVTGNVSVFCLYRVKIYFKAIPNSIDFYKGIFSRYSCSHYNSMYTGTLDLTFMIF